MLCSVNQRDAHVAGEDVSGCCASPEVRILVEYPAIQLDDDQHITGIALAPGTASRINNWTTIATEYLTARLATVTAVEGAGAQADTSARSVADVVALDVPEARAWSS